MKSRRKFIVTAILGMCGICTSSLPFSKRNFSINNSNKLWVDHYKCKSKLYPDKKYLTIEEFWLDHKDNDAITVNKYFLEKKLLISIKSTLLTDSKTVLIEKIYKNFDSKELFYKIWKEKARGAPSEFAALQYFDDKSDFIV